MKADLLDPDLALRVAREVAAPLPRERVGIADAAGRVLAAPVAGSMNLPPFANSAMDGYALGGTTYGFAAGSLWPVEGEQAAGAGIAQARDGAWAIMTGARIPEGLDRVVPVEQVEVLADPPRIRLLADVPPGQYVRAAGGDVAAGAEVLAAGTVLAPQHLILLAALGVAEVDVAARPRLAVLCTGSELVDDPAQPLGPGQIRNANGPFLAARVALAGAELVHEATVPDAPDAFLAALAAARAAGARVILSCGAVSMGQYDFIPRTLAGLGAEILFHKLAIRPGKPLLLARLPDGTIFFGLPGNPVSAAVGLRFFVEPALRVMLGLPSEPRVCLPLAADCQAHPRLRLYLKAGVEVDAEGRLRVRVLPGQESWRLRPLADANAWVVLPTGTATLTAGSLVEVASPGHLEGLGVARTG